jgi:hypothetical protein
LVEQLVHSGYMVAAPNFPLTSVSAFTEVKAPDIADAAEQIRDVQFLLDRLLADPMLSTRIDTARIATIGHSLGAITCYFLSFGQQTHDPRICATILMGAGDPVQAALSNDLGLAGIAHLPIRLPAPFLSAEKDLFTRTTGRPGAAFARLEGPKYEVMIARGTHTWFRDGDDWPSDHKNPDCLFFEARIPGISVPGGEERVPLIGPSRQREIVRAAVGAFLDAYIKGDRAALSKLLKLPQTFTEVNVTHAEA